MTVNDLFVMHTDADDAEPDSVSDPTLDGPAAVIDFAARSRTDDRPEPSADVETHRSDEAPLDPDGSLASSADVVLEPTETGEGPAARNARQPMTAGRHRSVSRSILSGDAPPLADLAGVGRATTTVKPSPRRAREKQPVAAPAAAVAAAPAGIAPPPVRPPRLRGGSRLLYALIALIAAIAIIVTVVQLRSASNNTGSGNLEPTASAYLDFARSGTIKDVLVKPGDHVRAGEVLAEQDTTAAEAQLSADQATLDADRARVLELGTGGASTQAAVNSLLAQANQQLESAQTKASASLSTAQTKVTAASTRLQAAQGALSADQAQYASSVAACNASGRTSASQPTDAECVQIQTALSNDTSAVSNSSQALSQAQLALKAAQTSSSQQLALANSAALLAAAKQGQTATTTTSTTTSDDAAANAAVARDIAAVASEESIIDDSAITSPVAGIVGSVGAQAGDFATPNGVHTFAQGGGSGSSSNGFTLFAPPAESSTGSGSSSGSGLTPVVIVYGTAMQVTAEFTEHTITKIHTGEAATVTIPALNNRSVTAVVADINPTAVTRNGRVSYVVNLNVTQTALTGAMPGMTVNVSFPRG